MRKYLFGMISAVLFSFGALTLSASAQAQPVPMNSSQNNFRKDFGFDGQVSTVQYRGQGYNRPHQRPGYRPQQRPPHYGIRPGFRPPRPGYRPPRCWMEKRRVWNGYRWIRRHVRMCRR